MPFAGVHRRRALQLLEPAGHQLRSEAVEVCPPCGGRVEGVEDLGRFEEARRYAERALALKEKLLGPEHLDLASPLINLGNAAFWSLTAHWTGGMQFVRWAIAIVLVIVNV